MYTKSSLIFTTSVFTLGTSFPINAYIPVATKVEEITGLNSLDDLYDIYSDEGNLG